MDKKRILLIGGPGTGKSTLLGSLKNKGYTCYPEISREVTIEAQKKGIEQLFLSEPLLFSKMLLEKRIQQHQAAETESEDIIFIDRGIPDVLAYMDYIGDTYPEEFCAACKKYLYHKIFILPIWQEIYTPDNERYENFEQAQLIQNYLVDTYQKFGYELIEIPKGSVDIRVDFIIRNL